MSRKKTSFNFKIENLWTGSLFHSWMACKNPKHRQVVEAWGNTCILTNTTLNIICKR